ncbi:MAG TPA: GspE/PulE family protein, partial [Candidatus Limnocylindria bacterium]|nr:GspE/PulE family protein [Candidatus Limnocylindria bacterium]
MPLSTLQLKEIFVAQSGLLKEEEFDSVVKIAAGNRQPLEHLLMEKGFVAPRHFLTLLSEYYKVPATDLKISEIDQQALLVFSEKYAAGHMVVAFAKDEGVLKVAMADPSDKELLMNLQQSAKMKIEPYVAPEHAIKRALVLYHGNIQSSLDEILEQIKQRGDESSDASVVNLLNSILETAVLMDASDVHIEPFETEIIIRFRVDGLLKTVAILPPKLHNLVIARLKVLASLKMDEKRLPQDGRFSIKIQDEEISIRISTVPSMWGEKAVMRILPKEAQLFDLASIGLLEADLELVRKFLKKPFGMILIYGPTNSGKTSTLYAFLEEIGIERIDVVNISTIEDPIEYTVPRITQIQIHPEINLTFAAGLRSLLRQDPDIIMVGEIRDSETADIAIRAALVGRLLLSSLHTNDAIGAIPRLIDMGVEPYLVSSTLALVLAQRLVRKLCPHCRQSYKPTSKELENLQKNQNLDAVLKVLSRFGTISKTTKASDLRFYKSAGC